MDVATIPDGTASSSLARPKYFLRKRLYRSVLSAKARQLIAENHLNVFEERSQRDRSHVYIICHLIVWISWDGFALRKTECETRYHHFYWKVGTRFELLTLLLKSCTILIFNYFSFVSNLFFNFLIFYSYFLFYFEFKNRFCYIICWVT